MTEQTTGDDGKATFQLAYGDYTATISKDGYTTKTENIAFRSNHKNFSITLVESGGTGTVTVTCQDESENPLANSGVVLSTEPIDFSSQDDTGFVAFGQTGSDGTVTLNLWDITTHQPTQDTDVPYGTYYFGGYNADGGIKIYTGTLTVDGDETVTITLTTPVVTTKITVYDENTQPLSGATVTISLNSETVASGTTDTNGEYSTNLLIFGMEYDLLVEATGYQDYEDTIEGGTTDKEVDMQV